MDQNPLHLLLIEDSEDETALLLHHLKQGGVSCFCRRVETEAAMRQALSQQSWDLIISDYSLPQFDVFIALKILHQSGLDIPFIILSDAISQQTAVAAMRSGAHDYVMKTDLTRLIPVVDRELREVRVRRARREAELALRRSEERLRQIITSISDVIYVIELDKSFELIDFYYSPQLAAFIGYDLDTITGNKETWFRSLIFSEDLPVYLEARQKILTYHKTEVEYRLKCADDTIIWLRDHAHLEVRDDGRIFIYGVVSDITEHTRLEEQFRQSQKMEAIGLLAGGIAHDFNNMLMIITGYSELLLTRHLSPGDPLRKDIEEIKKAGERAALLTHQLLAFSHKHIPQFQSVNLNQIIVDIEQMLSRIIHENINFYAILTPTPVYTMADRTQIEQVLLNLVVNARDAMPQGGELIIKTGRIDLDEETVSQKMGLKPGSYILLAVSDTGCGIDPQTQTHIFEPFFTTKPAGKGTGLGLSTVYAIVKQHDGYVDLQSRVGQGTTFNIYFPLIAPSASLDPQLVSLEKNTSGQETILVVEDQEEVREITSALLQNHGYKVLEAVNGTDALSIASQTTKPIHLLLTDVVMPEMSGPQLVSRLLAMRPSMRVVYMSGYSNEVIQQQGKILPYHAVIKKPFTAATLTRKVQEALATPVVEMAG